MPMCEILSFCELLNNIKEAGGLVLSGTCVLSSGEA
jgi:hypothetical protein